MHSDRLYVKTLSQAVAHHDHASVLPGASVACRDVSAAKNRPVSGWNRSMVRNYDGPAVTVLKQLYIAQMGIPADACNLVDRPSIPAA